MRRRKWGAYWRWLRLLYITAKIIFTGWISIIIFLLFTQIILRSFLFNFYRIAIKVFICKQFSGIPEIKNSKVSLAKRLIYTGATTNNLFKLRHALNIAIQHNQFAGLCIHTG